MFYRTVSFIVQRAPASDLKSCILTLLFVLSQFAHAAFSDNLTIGNAKALALGHAVTADPPGIDSIHLKFVYGMFETNYELGEYGEFQQ